jgi:hypothetical protein
MDGIIADGVCHTKNFQEDKRKMHLKTENIKIINEYWTEEKEKKQTVP